MLGCCACTRPSGRFERVGGNVRHRFVIDMASLPDAEGLPSLAQFSDKPALLAYANEQLRIRLKADYALDIDPDTVRVHTKEPFVPATVVVPGAPAPAPREPGTPLFRHRSRTLSELALENVGGLDFNFTHFSRLSENTRKQPDEALLPEDLTPATVNSKIRKSVAASISVPNLSV